MITKQGDVATITVNDKVISKHHAVGDTKAPLGLQPHPNIEFANIYIKELPRP